MTKPDNKNLAILFNSAKGGSGKTSLSLSAAVTAVMSDDIQKKFDAVYYFDFDLDGTGTEYLLALEDGKMPFNEYKSISDEFRCRHELFLANEERKSGKPLNAFVLSPKSRCGGSFFGEFLQERIETSCLDNLFMGNVIELLTHYTKDKGSSLFVFDNAPGQTSFSKQFAAQLFKIKDLDVLEVFATTFDAAHIEKSAVIIKNLIQKESHIANRKLVINDIHNALRIASSEGSEESTGLSRIDRFKRKRKYIERVADNVARDSMLDREDIIIREYKEPLVKHNAYDLRSRFTDAAVVDDYQDSEFYDQLIAK